MDELELGAIVLPDAGGDMELPCPVVPVDELPIVEPAGAEVDGVVVFCA